MLSDDQQSALKSLVSSYTSVRENNKERRRPQPDCQSQLVDVEFWSSVERKLMRVLGMPGTVVIKQSDSSEEDPEKNFTSQSHVLIAWKITKSDFFLSLCHLAVC